ncbi:MAG: putative lipopolysaccharide heptosyltransferase III [Limnobacter sp.]|nr:putative lipopolysaccharide heptosyltransferase III [Limnobacter sp.]
MTPIPLKKILVIKLRHHGDVLLTTALYRALAEQFPGIQIDTLIYKETTPLLQNNPRLHRILTIDRSVKGFKRLRAELALVRQIRQTRYDAVIHLTDQWIGALAARFSKAPKRVQMQYAKRDNALWHRSFTDRITPPERGHAHAVELNLLCLTALGVNPGSLQGKLELVPASTDLKEARSLLKQAAIEGDFVLIHPAARWPFKCWDDEKFAHIVNDLLKQGLNVVLTCSPDPVEKAMTRKIEDLTTQLVGRDVNQNSSGRGVLANWGGQVTLPKVAALLALCRFYIGVDSAPMHMAAALDVPQVALFGPSWVQEWRPWSDRAKVIYAGDYGPLPHPDSINTDDPTRLLEAIPVDVVREEVNRLIKDTDKT